MAKNAFKIDLNEPLRHLSRPPIVEAVIHWQARVQNPWSAEAVRSALTEALPQYTDYQPLEQFSFAAKMSESDAAPVVEHQKVWQGYRLTNADGLHVAQFSRDGVAFSRMKPYQNWQSFSAAAKEVWHTFVKIAAPLEVERLGVRFINHIPDATLDTVGEYLKEPPSCPAGLPLTEFLYQSTFAVPDQPFGIRVIKVMQNAIPDQPMTSGLFLDFDVHTTKPIPCSDQAVDDALVKMRWLKNKIFFALQTDKALNNFV